jgi:hypothetical protein
MKDYYKNNLEKFQTYYERNRERLLKQSKDYYHKNQNEIRPKQNLYFRKYYEKNKDEFVIKNRTYYHEKNNIPIKPKKYKIKKIIETNPPSLRVTF